MQETKRIIKKLVSEGLAIPAEKRHALRKTCRKFRSIKLMAMALFLDALTIFEMID